MGRVYQRGKTYYVDVNDRRRRIRRKIGKSKRIAELVLKDMELQIERGKWGFGRADGDISVLSESYLKHIKLHCRESSYLRYSGIVISFQGFLEWKYPKSKKVSDISRLTIEDYKQFRIGQSNISPNSGPPRSRNCKESISARTLNLELKTLKSMFKYGTTSGLSGINPFEDVKLLKVDKKKLPKFLSRDECTRFMESCLEEDRFVFRTFLNTGMRMGELLNLQWRDVDLEQCHIRIQAKTFWEPKSGERIIPLAPVLTEELLERKNGVRDTDFVFRDPNDENAGRRLRKKAFVAARNAGIEGKVNLHTFRHTFASHLVMSEVDLPTVQKLLGHAEINSTMIYAHLATKHLRNAVIALNDIGRSTVNRIRHVDQEPTVLTSNDFDQLESSVA